ncbi:MAG: T9SS type A sorting domain-containing protein [Bacteroidota bacterium]
MKTHHLFPLLLLLWSSFQLTTQSSENQETTINGIITRPNGEPVGNVEVEARGINELEAFTDENGAYSLPLELDENPYAILPYKSRFEEESCINQADAVLLFAYLLGELELSPYSLIAADVNNSGSVTSFDYFSILNYSIEHGFGGNTDWRFVPKDYEFPDPSNPFMEEFPEPLAVDENYEGSYDFIGVKIGDLSYGMETQEAENFKLEITDKSDCFEADDTVTFEVIVNQFEDLVAVGFSLGWDSELFEGINVSDINDNLETDEGDFLVEEDHLLFRWADLTLTPHSIDGGQNLFRLSLLAKQRITTNTQICFSDHLPFEAIDVDMNLYDRFEEDCGEITTLCPPIVNAVPCDSVELVIDTFYCNADKTVFYQFSLNNHSSQYFDAVDFYDPITGELIGINTNGGLEPQSSFGPLSRNFTPNEEGMVCIKVFLFNYEEELCCHTELCVEVPRCINCEEIEATAVPQEEGACCYDLKFTNNDENHYSKVVATLTTEEVSFDNVQANDAWQVTENQQELTIFFAEGNIPEGTSTPLSFCLSNVQYSHQSPQEIILEWYADFEELEEVVCRDTIELDCQCAMVQNENLVCNSDGSIQLELDLVNQSERNISFLRFDVIEPVGIEFDNCLPKLIPVENVDVFPISLQLNDCGTPLRVGTEVKYRISMLDSETDDWCCHLDTLSMMLPDCRVVNESVCECEEDFEQQIDQGFHIRSHCEGFRQSFEFQPRANFSDCDELFWTVDNRNIQSTTANESISYRPAFPFPRPMTICMTVVRTQADGKQCQIQHCKRHYDRDGCSIVINPGDTLRPPDDPLDRIMIAPNPVNEQLRISMPEQRVQYQIFDAQGRRMQYALLTNDRTILVHELQTGIYFLHLQLEDGRVEVRRFVKQ